MKKLIDIAPDVNKALIYIQENYDGKPISYNELINDYLRTYIELFFTNGKDILNR